MQKSNEEIKSEFSESLAAVLTEMCRRVGADYNTIDFSDERWYNSCEWTVRECKTFQKWLSDYLYNSSKVRRELMKYSYKRRKSCDDFAQGFTFQFGWRYSECD